MDCGGIVSFLVLEGAASRFVQRRDQVDAFVEMALSQMNYSMFLGDDRMQSWLTTLLLVGFST